MEAIKCPNCGSEKIQELTEEKYVCLACDNVFLVHNLSKEFRQTDEHISEIHRDLKDTLENLNIGEGKDGLNNLVKNANALFKQGKIESAQSKFLEICEHYAWSYQGYYGMFCCVLNSGNYKIQTLLEYCNRMKACDDYTLEVDEEVNAVFNVLKENLVEELHKSKEKCTLNINEAKNELDSITSQNKDLNAKLWQLKAKDWGKTELYRKVICIALAVVAILILISITKGLWGWIAGTKYLFQKATQEKFINMIWQFLIYGIGGILKIVVSIAIILGAGYVSLIVVMIPLYNEEKDQAEQEAKKTEEALYKRQTEKRDLEQKIEKYDYIQKKIEEMVSAIEELDISNEVSIQQFCDIEPMISRTQNLFM